MNISILGAGNGGTAVAADLCKNRQSLFFRIMNISSSIRNRSQILHIKFED
jgi:saccharopine dehydrogenase-like NADP-dependent oxidoreductase